MSLWAGLYLRDDGAERKIWLDARLSAYLADMKKLRGSIHNATKTAICAIYYAQIQASNGADFNAVLQLQAYVDDLLCWIRRQNAYEGPCAYTVISVAQAFGSPAWHGMSPLSAIVESIEGDSQPNVDLAVATFNRTSDIIIQTHNCCSVTAVKLQARTIVTVP
ncbi:unnamed protein product [marine sediment metagenome]|uniref:Uncharacterized protein n=1 Tax=marine sediment metagenome TaxID=412755 RepID=X1B481_9ZZZZ